MKKLPILMLSLMTFPVSAQTVLSTLNKYQSDLKEPGSSPAATTTAPATADVKPTGDSLASTSLKCTENDQTSLPLAYVTSLIQEKNAALDIVHDPKSGTLSISSADMIGNCSSMLEWSLKQPEIQGKKAYVIEVKIKNGDDCKAEGCSYKVAKVANGEFKEFETLEFKPTLKGFEQCLQKSGVIAAGKIVPGAIYSSPVTEKFHGLDYTGKLLFLSHGPATPLVKAKYGKFEFVNGCDHYEAAHSKIKNVMTLADAEKDRLDAEATKLKDCKVEEYGKLADFIKKHQEYEAVFGKILEDLLLQAAKKSAAAITAGKYTDDDLKVLQDFDQFVVTPKVEKARALYDEMVDLEGDAKKAKQEQLKTALAQINALNQKPYFTSAHTHKLIQDGKFPEAETLNSMQLVIENHKRLGSKIENVVITPKVAAQRVATAREQFKQALEGEKEKYEYKTGQVTGKGNEFAGLASRMRKNIEIRTFNFQAEMMAELERVQQPNGYCYKYWRNTNKCIQETYERLQELQAMMAHFNKVDAERAAEFDAKAGEYRNLEAQGRRYLAAQNGEEVPAEVAKPTEAPNTLAPTPRPPTQDANNQIPQYGQQQQPFNQQPQFIPQQQQSPIAPYGYQNSFQQPNPYQYMPQQQQQQYSYMGQYSYGNQSQSPYGYQPQGQFNLGFNGGAQNQIMPYGYGQQQQGYGQQGFGQQQGQFGYGQMPYQAYGQYNMYGMR